MDCIKDKVRGRGNDTSHLDPGDIPRILRGNERKCFSRVLKLSVHVRCGLLISTVSADSFFLFSCPDFPTAEFLGLLCCSVQLPDGGREE
jgi:hypothetical protein